MPSLSSETVTSVHFCEGHIGSPETGKMPMVALIWIGTVILCLIGHSAAIVTTAITTAVAFVVAGISPGPAWIQPILRLADSAVGIVSGFLLHGWELPFSVGKENGTDLSDLRQTLFTIER